MFDNIFGMCVHILDWMSEVTGLSYKEISVVFNLWIQGGFIVLLGLVTFLMAIWSYCRTKTICAMRWLIETSILMVIYLIGFGWVLCHYTFDMNYAFDLCLADLMELAEKLQTTYNMVNIVVFIVGWLLVVLANILFIWKLKNISRMKS